MQKLAAAAALALLALAAPRALDAAPPDAPKVVIEAPADGAAIRRLTFPLRAKVESAEKLASVELVRLRPDERSAKHREKAVAMKQLADGKWALDAVERPQSKERLVVRARDAKGGEATVEVRVVDETGWTGGFPELRAPGTPTPATIEATALGGKKVEVPPRSGAPTVVLFYGTWDDCEHEIAWLKAKLAKYGPKGLQVIGVGSVAPADADAWKAYLARHEVSWENVIDADGALARAYWMSARKAVGNAAHPVLYFAKGGQLLGGDFVEAASMGQFELSTTEGLEKAFR